MRAIVKKCLGLLLTAIVVMPSTAAFAQQRQTAASDDYSVVWQKKTPITSFPNHSLDDFVTFAMAYANAKTKSLTSSDPVVAKEWHDYFITSVSSTAIPPGVLAFSHKIKALAEAAQTNPNIVLANITGEQVMDVVFKNYQQHLEATGAIPSRP
jgi:hypothetical protein